MLFFPEYDRSQTPGTGTLSHKHQCKTVNCNSEEMTVCIYTDNNKHHTSAFSRQFI